jgi:tetratricopeptide (TPR) repeat protein
MLLREENYSRISAYLYHTGAYGSYYISKAASAYSDREIDHESLLYFEKIRLDDPYYVRDMDVYSTLLWRRRDKRFLHLLGKELIYSNQSHYITWTVLGNYYSLAEDFKRAIICLKRSININENHYAYQLLGFEYSSTDEYRTAETYFKSSLSIQSYNSKAWLGLGAVYIETSKRSQGLLLFEKALKMSPHSLQIKAYVSKYYVKIQMYDEAYERIRAWLNLKGDCFEEVVKSIEDRSGSYNGFEDLILCELADVFIQKHKTILARKILNLIESRTSTYYSKKSRLKEKEDDRSDTSFDNGYSF